MKINHNYIPRGFCIAMTLFGASAIAQDEDTDGEIFELSPFTVDGTGDEGYRATHTMAGGRLNQSLKDTGSAIQVVTEEFMGDIGATNMEELLQYTTSSEVAGILGNFTASEDLGLGEISTEEARRNPDAATRVRGIAAPDRTRNFFVSLIPFDSYNSGRIDINRGANSFLFGLGTPAGVINHDVARAGFKDTNMINFRIGSGGANPSMRTNFKINRVLIDDKLAFAVAGLVDRTEYRQRPTFKDDDRLYATAKFRPFGNSKTVFNAHVEVGNTDGNAPDVLLPLHNLDTFIDGGAGIDYGDGPIDPAAAALIARRGIDVYANIRKFRNQQAPEYRNQPTNQSLTSAPGWFNSALGLVYDGSNGREPAFGYSAKIRNSDLDRGDSFWDPENNNSTNGNNMYHNNRGIIGPSGWETQGFTNLDTFDFSKYNLGWDNDYYTRDFSNYNLSLQQTFWEGKAGFEIATDYQDMEKSSFTAFNGASAMLVMDINETLFLPDEQFQQTGIAGNPDMPETEAGAVINPNYGRVFAITDSDRRIEELTREAHRFTAFAKYDFADSNLDDKLVGIFGNHTLTFLADKSEFNERRINWTYAPFGTGSSTLIDGTPDTYDPGESIGPDNARYVGNAARKVPQMVYLSGFQQGAFTDPAFGLESFQLHPAKYQLERPSGYQIDRWVWDADDKQWEETTIVHRQVPNKNGRLQRNKVTSLAVNTQSKFLNNHLVLNLGYREDVIDNWLNTRARFIGEGTENPDIDETPDISPAGWSFNDTERTRYQRLESSAFGYGAVLYFPKNLIELPEWIDDISFRYNASQNFVPRTERVDQYANPIPSPEGDSKDYGVSIHMLNNKFIAKFNWYEGTLENDSSPVTRIFPRVYFRYFSEYSRLNSNIIRYLRDEHDFDPNAFAESGTLPTNPDTSSPFGSYDELTAYAAERHEVDGQSFMQKHLDALEDLKRHLTPELADNWDPRIAPDGGLQYEVPGDVSDTVTIDAKGFEAEFIFNPTDNWRIAFNAAKQETVYTDVAPRLTELVDGFILDHLEQFGDLRWDLRLDRIRGQSVRDQYNDRLILYYTAKAQEGKPNSEQRKWRFNMITNYQFKGGPLKGFGVGGAYRWQDEYVAGYELMELDNGFTIPDINNTFLADTQQSYDLWFKYGRKIFNDKIKWKVQLNLKNLQNIDSDKVSVVSYQPDGSVARARFDPPFQLWLSNNFQF